MNTNFGYLIILGLATARLFKVVALDRITQVLRYWVIRRLNKAGGLIPHHLQYLLGCALCAPIWIAVALYTTRQFALSRDVAFILAVCMVAYALLRWLNETELRDWPPEVQFPPRGSTEEK